MSTHQDILNKFSIHSEKLGVELLRTILPRHDLLAAAAVYRITDGSEIELLCLCLLVNCA